MDFSIRNTCYQVFTNIIGLIAMILFVILPNPYNIAAGICWIACGIILGELERWEPLYVDLSTYPSTNIKIDGYEDHIDRTYTCVPELRTYCAIRQENPKWITIKWTTITAGNVSIERVKYNKETVIRTKGVDYTVKVSKDTVYISEPVERVKTVADFRNFLSTSYSLGSLRDELNDIIHSTPMVDLSDEVQWLHKYLVANKSKYSNLLLALEDFDSSEKKKNL